ncbi:MAG TPA: HAD family hydrolase [Acidimicrobiales bacterium]|nr:HAD family hydrolase [Acidimicrobiales bacterium]
MLRLALFDLDNTLVDRQAAFRRWAGSFASRRGMDGDVVAWLCAADGDGFATRHELFSSARRHLGLEDPVTELIAEYRAEYFGFFEPDPAVLAALERLRGAGWRIGIVTNGPATQREKIRRAGLAPFVDGCCISDELGMEKPDRRIFDEAVRRCTGSDDERGAVWMIGDTPMADIAGGRAAGLRTVWLRRGRDWSEQGFRPDVVASSLREAADHLIDATVAP